MHKSEYGHRLASAALTRHQGGICQWDGEPLNAQTTVHGCLVITSRGH